MSAVRAVSSCVVLCVVVLHLCRVTSVLAQISDDPWPRFGADIQNTHQSTYGQFLASWAAAPWDHGGPNLTWPILSDADSLYVVAQGGIRQFAYLYSISAETGEEGSWALNLDARAELWGSAVQRTSAPVMDSNGILYLAVEWEPGTYAGEVLAFDTNTGSVAWRYLVDASGVRLSGPLDGPAAAALHTPLLGEDGTLYVHVAEKLLALPKEPATRLVEPEWTRSGALYSCLNMGPDGMLYARQGEFLHAISPRDGMVEGRFWLDGAVVQTGCPAIAPDGTIYTTTTQGIQAHAPNGRELWRIHTDGVSDARPATTPMVGPDGTVYYGGFWDRTSAVLTALDPAEGDVRWTYDATQAIDFLGIDVAAPSLAPDGSVMFIIHGTNSFEADESRFYALDMDTGQRAWSYAEVGLNIVSPAVYAASGSFYAVDQGLSTERRILHAYDLPQLTISPKELDFETVEIDTGEMLTIEVRNDRSYFIDLSNIRITGPDSDYFQVLAPFEVISPETAEELRIRFEPDAQRSYQAELAIEARDGATYYAVLSGVGVQPAPELSVVPAQTLDFGTVRVETTRQDAVLLTNSGRVDVDVTRLEVEAHSPEVFRIIDGASPGTLSPGDRWRVVLAFQPEAVTEYSTGLLIESTGGDIDVELVGEGEVALDIDPASIDFPLTRVGATDTADVTVTNTSREPVQLEGVDITGADANVFDIAEGGYPIELAAGQRHVVAVVFAPAAAGAFDAILEIATDGQGYEVPLSGEAGDGDLVANPARIAFGIVAIGDTDYATVTLSNEGTLPIEISTTEIDEGSDVFLITSGEITESLVLEPGDDHTITVAFAPAEDGSFEADLIVDYDAAETLVIPLSGEGRAPVLAVDPADTVDFGKVIAGASTEADLVLVNDGEIAVEVISLAITGDDHQVFEIEAGWDGAPRSIPAEGGENTHTVSLRFAPAVAGSFSATMEIRSDGGDFDIVLVGEAGEGELVADPGRLDFGLVPVGETMEASLTLLNQGTADVEIFEIDVLNAAFTLAAGGVMSPFKLEPGEEHNLNVTFTPSEPEMYEGTVVIGYNTEETLEVALTGEGGEGKLAVDPDELDFGVLALSDTESRTVTMSNPGSIAVEVSSIRISGPESGAFELVAPDTPLSLHGGDEEEIIVVFTAGERGEKRATLEIQSSSGPLNVPLLALVQAPQLGVEPSAVDFGDVPLGQTSEQRLSVVNTGNDVLTIDEVTLLSDQSEAFAHAAGDLPVVLGPEEEWEVLLQFRPLQSGSASATLVLAGKFGENEVTLTGAGLGVDVAITEPVVEAGEPATIEGHIEGFSPEVGTLYFRRGGDNIFARTTLTLSNGAFEAIIPGSEVTERGVDYYVSFSDSAFSFVYPASAPDAPAHLIVRVPAVSAGGHFAPNTYRMVSVPLELEDPRATSVLSGSYGAPDDFTWRLLRWHHASDSYRDARNDDLQIHPGKAFWLITRSGDGFELEGGRSISTSEPFSITLEPGWNQIGNPFSFPVHWTHVAFSVETEDEAIEPPVFFDGASYLFDEHVLQPWQGYFVHNSSPEPVMLYIPPAESGEAEGAKRKTQADLGQMEGEAYTVHIAASLDGDLHNDLASIGFLKGNGATSQQHLRRMPPPIGEMLRAQIAGEEAVLARHLKALDERGAAWDVEVVHTTAMRENATVDVQLLEKGTRPEYFEIHVVDSDRKRVMAIEEGSFSFVLEAQQPVRRFRVIIGTDAFAEDQQTQMRAHAQSFALNPNYPNPFDAQTSIPFMLADAQDVRIEVFSGLGQRVITLVDAHLKAGFHEVAWDGRTAAGQAAASGVYYVRMLAGDFSEVRSIVLIR